MNAAERLSSMLRASLIADALSLPAHWIYDPQAIAQQFGRVDSLIAPPVGSYHGNQALGGQTHYGDQALVLMASMASGGFDVDDFAARWRAMWDGYTGYVDGATRDTLANLKAGVAPAEAGSRSSDLGGAARIAPLIVATIDMTEERALEAAWAQTVLTHRDPAVGEAALFLVRACRAAIAGASLGDALAAAADADYLALPVRQHLETARQAAKQSVVEAVRACGAACPVQMAFPATLAIAFAYPADLETALIENVMAGGDSAARGLMLGMLLGAATGAALPANWLDHWRARPQVEAFLASR